MSTATVEELKEKEVINIKDGARLGYITNLEIDTCNGCIITITVGNGYKMLGFLCKDDDGKIINWCDIKKIGDDIILVCVEVD